MEVSLGEKIPVFKQSPSVTYGVHGGLRGFMLLQSIIGMMGKASKVHRLNNEKMHLELYQKNTLKPLSIKKSMQR